MVFLFFYSQVMNTLSHGYLLWYSLDHLYLIRKMIESLPFETRTLIETQIGLEGLFDFMMQVTELPPQITLSLNVVTGLIFGFMIFNAWALFLLFQRRKSIYYYVWSGALFIILSGVITFDWVQLFAGAVFVFLLNKVSFEFNGETKVINRNG